jgi:uncharacterized Zn-binding protein involved in type VI secretion
MGKPAARIGDWHNCPRVSPNGLPHAGGPIVGGGCLSVWIEGRLAATTGDTCLCAGDVDEIKSGSTGVYIEGRPAARQGDWCVHGGVVVGGSGTVFIGERMVRKSDFPIDGEKRRAINQAIKDCTVLLEKKLALLEQGDPQTLENFKKWFGRDDDEAKGIILEMIRKALEVSMGLTVENFEEILDEKERRETCAISYSGDELYRIKVGIVFWKIGACGNDSKSAAIIHELSHFKDIGNTEDVIYGEKDCLSLAKSEPHSTLKNASSFEYFVVE